jgi:hypothetical protein
MNDAFKRIASAIPYLVVTGYLLAMIGGVAALLSLLR